MNRIRKVLELLYRVVEKNSKFGIEKDHKTENINFQVKI